MVQNKKMLGGYMYLKDIVSILDSSPMTIFKQEYNSDILFVDRLDEETRMLTEDTLYFAKQEVLDRVVEDNPSNLQLSVVILLEEKPLTEKTMDSFTNVIGFKNEEHYLKTADIIRRAISNSLRYNNHFQEFMELMAREDDLSVLMNWLSEFFGHPVNLVDNSFTYIAHSDLAGFVDFGSDELMKDVTNGYVSPDHILKIQQSQDADLFRLPTTEPRLIYAPSENFQQYHTPVPIGGTIAGAFSVYLHMDEILDPVKLLYLKKVARLISIVLRRINFYSANKASFYTSFFSDLLRKTPDPAKLWESRLRAYGFQLFPSLHVLLVELPDNVQHQYERQNLASTLQNMFPESIYQIREQHIVLLCSNRPGQFLKMFGKNINNDFFVRSNIKIGISSEFTSIYDLSEHYEEAKNALEIGELFAPKNNLYLYDNLRTYDMVYQLSKITDIRSYCYQPFMELFNYDIEHGTEYGKTLYFYLLDVKKPLDVSRRLNIHKNTLYFRLDKIRSIMNVDFDNLPVASQIFITIIILRYTGDIQETVTDIDRIYYEYTAK